MKQNKIGSKFVFSKARAKKLGYDLCKLLQVDKKSGFRDWVYDGDRDDEHCTYFFYWACLSMKEFQKISLALNKVSHLRPLFFAGKHDFNDGHCICLELTVINTGFGLRASK